MGRPSVRPYRAEDRAAVRRIAFETGYMGKPIDWMWREPESFADLITTYYTDREPESSWVAEMDGRVVGYLQGCVRSRDSLGAVSAAARRILLRGALFRPGVAGVFWRSFADLIRDREAPEEALLDARWPAHLHINLLPEARGQGAGAALVRSWFDHLRAGGSAGVHLGMFSENHNAAGFFRSQGFAPHGDPVLAPGFRMREGARMHAQWMVQSLA